MSALTLHPLLQNHAILQRSKSLQLHGWCPAGAEATLDFAGRSYLARASADGRFTLVLPPQPAGGPHHLVFQSSGARVDVSDVYFGDVYLAGGQSNMQLPFGQSSRQEVDRALFLDPLLRVLLVPQRAVLPEGLESKDWTCGAWHTLEAEHLDEFSAVASYAGLLLREHQADVPIGIVGAYMGATSASCWTSGSSLAEEPELSVYEKEFQDRIKPYLDPLVYKAALSDYEAKAQAWNKAASAYPGTLEAELTRRIGPVPWPPPENQDSWMRPGGLYETMIKPLAGWTFCGIFFYQGEGDVPHADLYPLLLRTMLRDWRKLFGEIPFIQVQLPAYHPDPSVSDDSSWGALRQAQREVSLTVPLVSHVVSLDQGQIEDLHPKAKHIIGRRLGLAALAWLHASHEEAATGGVDLYFGDLSLSDHMVQISVRSQADKLAFVPQGEISGFEVELQDGSRLALPANQVQVDGLRISLLLPNAFSDRLKAVMYGMFNGAVATIFTKTDFPGTLEAFRVEV